jgi:transglutaminase-like putative cysteine protease
LAIACARSLGWAARYVSGYVYTAAFRGKGHRIASDASHAWFDVFDPLTGWRGFDPANNRRVDGNYIVVARGRDYNDACPLQGTFQGGGVHRLDVSVDVQQIG